MFNCHFRQAGQAESGQEKETRTTHMSGKRVVRWVFGGLVGEWSDNASTLLGKMRGPNE